MDGKEEIPEEYLELVSKIKEVDQKYRQNEVNFKSLVAEYSNDITTPSVSTVIKEFERNLQKIRTQ